MGVPQLLTPSPGFGPGVPLTDIASALSECTAEDALDVIEAMEQLKRWADGVTVAATRVFGLRITTTHLDARARDHDGELSDRARLQTAREAQSAAADEIAIVTGLGAGMARDLVGVACAAPERTATGMAAMLAGQTCLYRVATLWRECQDLPARAANEIAEKTLAPTRDGVPLSQRLFRQRLNRAIACHQPPTRRREKAVAARDVSFWHRGDGTTELAITGESERATAAHTRICQIAKRLRETGDTRTPAQLRSDVALDLLLYGAPQTTGTSRPDAADAVIAARGHDLRETLLRRLDLPVPPRVDSPTGGKDQTPWWLRFSGALPPAQVTVTVPLTSLIGVGDEPAEIATTTGAEHVPAWLARDIAFTAGSTWRRLVTDPHTGHALGASSGAYTPPPRMRSYVLVRDHHCRAPGCTRPATGCDLDHSTPWPRGATSDDNLSAKHRGHHNHKTRGLWSCEQRPDGSIEWTLASGHTYTTLPHSYSPPVGQESNALHRLLDSRNPDILAALHTTLDERHAQLSRADDEVRDHAPENTAETPARALPAPNLPVAHIRPAGLADLVIRISAPELLADTAHTAHTGNAGPGEPPF